MTALASWLALILAAVCVGWIYTVLHYWRRDESRVQEIAELKRIIVRIGAEHLDELLSNAEQRDRRLRVVTDEEER